MHCRRVMESYYTVSYTYLLLIIICITIISSVLLITVFNCIKGDLLLEIRINFFMDLLITI